MKIITWNLGYWLFRKYHEEAWRFLRTQVKPDVALLQEVRPMPLNEGEFLVFHEVHKGWGTAVYANNLELHSVAHQTKYPNRVAVAETRTSGGEILRLASIHAPIIKNRVFPHLSLIMDEVEQVVDGESAIIGGDLNSARLAEKVWPGYGHGPFFARMDQSRFKNCCQIINGRELQTYFRKGGQPWQDDHLFITHDLAPALTKCDVIETTVTRRVSDHIPLWIELSV